MKTDLFGPLPNESHPDVSTEYKTYRAITVGDTAHLHGLAVMIYRKPLRIGGKCWLDLISLIGQQSTLGKHYQNLIP